MCIFDFFIHYMYILIEGKTMKNKQRKFAVKLYLRRIEEDPNYSENQFAAEVQQYMNENFSSNPLYNAYDPFSLWADIANLWKALNMSPYEIVEYSGLKMSEFAARYVIPYRTLQAWCDGTNPCPIYIRIMLCELLGILRKTERKDGER